MSTPPYTTRLLGQDEYAVWDQFVESSGRGTLFHQTHWLGAFDRPFAVIGCFNDSGKLVGGLPLSYQRLAGLTVVRPPYLTPYQGPLTFKADGKHHRVVTYEKDIVAALLKHVMSFGDFARIPLAPGHFDLQPFQAYGFGMDVEHTYVITLDDIGRVWDGLNQDRKRKVRNAMKEGLVCQYSDNIDSFFPLWQHSLAAHDLTPPASRISEIRKWYQALSATGRAQLIQTVDPAGKILAATVLVWDHRRAYYLLSGMDRKAAGENTMSFLLWHSMNFCKEELGLHEFDFDGSDIPSVEFFFRGFGGHLASRFTVTWGRTALRSLRQLWMLTGALRSGFRRTLTRGGQRGRSVPALHSHSESY